MLVSPSGLSPSGPLRIALLAPKALLVGIFLFAVGSVVSASLRDPDGHLTIGLYANLIATDTIQILIWRTVKVAGLTTLICALLAYPLASFIASSHHRNLLLILVISPWLTSIIVRTFGWIVILGNRGVLNTSLRSLGLIETPLRILFTPAGTILGLVHVLLPFMIISILAVLVQLDRHLPEAGMSLGAGPIQTFLRITFPLSLPGVLSGCSLTYLLASGAIVTPILLGGLRDTMLGTQIFQEIFALYNFNRAAAMAMVLLVTSLVVVIPVQWVEARLRRPPGVSS
jgi:putative spermidine/putrescine transport system permease protein